MQRSSLVGGRVGVWAFVGLLAWAAGHGGASSATSQQEDARPIQVFVVRHAEKADDDPRDPSLSEAGQQRAKALAQLLRSSKVTHLFSSEYRRTQLTLTPLAERFGLEIDRLAAAQSAGAGEMLRALPPGSVAVVAGHSNTVPAIVESLGLAVDLVEKTPRGRMLKDDEYDRLFLVTMWPDEVERSALLELRIPPSFPESR